MSKVAASVQLKAVTIMQPWASLIARGIKTLEVRSWLTNHRGPLVIHSSKNVPKRDAAALKWSKETYPGDYPLGSVVAIAELVDCRRPRRASDAKAALMEEHGGLQPSDWLWCLANIQPCVAVAVSGGLRLWQIDPALVRVLPGTLLNPAASVVTPRRDDQHAAQKWIEKAMVMTDHAAVVQVFRRGLAKLPDNATLLSAFGTYLFHRDKTSAEAESCLVRAHAMAPEDSGCATALASFLVAAKQPAAAEQLYREALDNDAYNGPLALRFAEFLRMLPERQLDAEPFYQRAIALATQLSELRPAVEGAVDFFIQVKNNLDEAEQVYRKLLQRFPQSSGPAHLFARFLVKHRQSSDEAEAIYRQLIERAPQVTTAAIELAGLLIGRRHDLDGGEKLLRQALAADPKDHLAEVYLAGLLLLRGRPAEARPLVESVLAPYAVDDEGEDEDEAEVEDEVDTQGEDEDDAQDEDEDEADAQDEDEDEVDAQGEDEDEEGEEDEDDAVGVSCEQAEAALYLAVLDRLEGQDPGPALELLRNIIDAGYPRWFGLSERVVDSVCASWPENERARFQALAKAVLDEKQVPALASFVVERSPEAEMHP